MFGLDLVTVGGLLILATNSIQCKVPDTPTIKVDPVTYDIQYDFSYGSADLSMVETGSKSPYSPDVDTSTGGLRHDTPSIETNMSWGIQSYRHAGASCMWFKDINVKITLQPKIYISRDYKSDECREAILDHEERHVQVDREVINKFAYALGIALQSKIRSVGAVGPYSTDRQQDMQDVMTSYIQETIDQQQEWLHQEMRVRQAQIDSLTEYEAISTLCHRAEFDEKVKRQKIVERDSRYNR